MSNDTPLTLEQINEQLKALMAKKRAMNSKPRKPRAVKEKKPVRKQRLVVCIYCGKPDKKTNMQKVSKYEYEHPLCERLGTIVKVGFAFND